MSEDQKPHISWRLRAQADKMRLLFGPPVHMVPPLTMEARIILSDLLDEAADLIDKLDPPKEKPPTP